MKFFISSTYTDLVDYRIFTINYLLNLTKEKTGDVAAMEFFVASELTCREECLRELCDSDVVIGIYGTRYGSIDEISGLSMTEVEFDYAMNHGKPILAFVTRDEMEANQRRFVEEKVFARRTSCARFNSVSEYADRFDDTIKRYLKNTEGFSYSSLWGHVKESKGLIKKEIESGSLHMEIYEDGDEEKAINEMLEAVENIQNGLSCVYSFYGTIYSCKTDEEIAEAARKMLNENWECFHLAMPNNLTKIRLSAAFLQLCNLQDKLLREIWTEELRVQAIKIRDDYLHIAEASYFVD